MESERAAAADDEQPHDDDGRRNHFDIDDDLENTMRLVGMDDMMKCKLLVNVRGYCRRRRCDATSVSFHFHGRRRRSSSEFVFVWRRQQQHALYFLAGRNYSK